MIEFEFTGNWEVAGRVLKKLPNILKSSGIYGQRKAAEMIVKIAKNHINNQDLGWAPRAQRSSVADSRILVHSEDYYGAIKAWKRGDEYYAGVSKDAVNSKGTSITEYALAHEYGFGNMPQRPLWEPSFKDIGGKKGVERIVKMAIKNKISKLQVDGFEVYI